MSASDRPKRLLSHDATKLRIDLSLALSPEMKRRAEIARAVIGIQKEVPDDEKKT